MEEYGNRDFRKVNLGLPINSRNRASSSMEIMWEKTIYISPIYRDFRDG